MCIFQHPVLVAADKADTVKWLGWPFQLIQDKVAQELGKLNGSKSYYRTSGLCREPLLAVVLHSRHCPGPSRGPEFCGV